MVLLPLGGLLTLVLLGFWIWALIDCIATDRAAVRNLPKGVWIFVIVILPDIGSLAWLVFGRPEKRKWRPGAADYSAPRRPLGIEDDPGFSSRPNVTEQRSAELDRRLEQWEAEQQAQRERRDREVDGE
jgi:Phospholipase_D-nuclease N-terminal